MHILKNLRVVLNHKFLVLKYSFIAGIPFRGLIHDTSKFSFIEFFISAKNCDGKKSPTINERTYKFGVSEVCLHHTGRNKHHWQYWVDFEKNEIVIAKMPYKICVEFVCDMLSASKTYNKKSFSYEKLLDYYLARKDLYLMHPGCKEFVKKVFINMIDEKTKALKKNKTKSLFNEIMKKYDETYFVTIPNEVYKSLEEKE